MKITNDSGCLEFTIFSYQFPNLSSSSGGQFNHDSNWLSMQLKYTEASGQVHIHTDSCILTYELEEFRDALLGLLDGELTQYRSDFMEPYLQISIQPLRETYRITIDACDFDIDIAPSEQNPIPFSALLTRAELAAALEDISELCSRYPQR